MPSTKPASAAGTAVGAAAGAAGTKIALGIDRYLDETASTFNAITWEDLGVGRDMVSFRDAFMRFRGNSNNTAVFNLKDVHLDAAVQRVGQGIATATDWELQQIANHPDWWSRIDWVGGRNPFANGNPFSR